LKVIIPAYQPDTRMLELIQNIKENSDFDIIIVNDGSSAKYNRIFEQAAHMGCYTLVHERNLGKGAALKTAFTYLLEKHCEDSIICADCDGQHTWQDIQKIAKTIPLHPSSIILGCRKFAGKVPLRSKFGNSITSSVFQIISGTKISDTQTGLRGLHAAMLPWLVSLKGNRYEYEMNQLLEAKKAGYDFFCIRINTIYENKNKGSHFLPIRDSIRIYLPIVKFSMSSLICGCIDFALLFAFKRLTSSLLSSVIMARVISALCNYLLNKHLVFAKEGRRLLSLLQYYGLAVLILGCNYLLLFFLNERLGVPLSISKLITEAILFLASYHIQHKIIFASARKT
jgi:putative flippase GtrA